jgi:hypothetical protein
MNYVKHFLIIFLYQLALRHVSSAADSPVMVKFGIGGLQTNSNRTDARSQSLQSIYELSVLGQISERGFLNISSSFFPKIYSRTIDSLVIKERNYYLQMGIGYQQILSDSLKAGFDFATHYRLSDPELIYFSPGIDPTITDTSARDDTEYGFDLILSYNLMKFEKFKVDFDMKYFFSTTAKTAENANHIYYLIAVNYFWDQIN